ncbi:MAG: tetratricopeptide repeat protein [Spirochaetales bacterium]|jgi:TolA-binding protein|nr:tetratricopeptide repeat protein [Spirochaetales bacterium]
MTKFIRLAAALAAACVLTAGAAAQEGGASSLHRGIGFYKVSDFEKAADAFREAARGTGPERGDAHFWLAKTLSALERYDEAALSLEHFVKSFPSSAYFPEAVYERGRLLYFQRDYDAAIIAFQHFLTRYPDSQYAPNAFFWTGEALFALGNLSQAERMFMTVVNRYPTSSRLEAARYRAAVIGLKHREEELLKLLRWSHEEYLKAQESRQSLERTYAEIVDSYQRQLAALNTGNLSAEVVRLSEETHRLKSELAAQKSQHSSSSGPEYEGQMRILAAREEALTLKEAYLEQLIQEYEGKR